MRRVGRWILNGAAAISLVLCVATVALWLRRHGGRRDSLSYSWLSAPQKQRSLGVDSDHGHNDVGIQDVQSAKIPYRLVGNVTPTRNRRFGPIHFMEFSLFSWTLRAQISLMGLSAFVWQRYMQIPIWWASGGGGIFRGAEWFLVDGRAKTRRSCLSQVRVRSRQTGERCPECGTAVEKAIEPG